MPYQPRNMKEFTARYTANTRITGYGFGVVLHYPCPFCAAPEWESHTILQTQEVLSKPHYCTECERTACVVFSPVGVAIEMELVQTDGPDVPDWFIPKPRRRGVVHD